MPPQPSDRPPPLPALTSLRWFAALMVLVFHYCGTLAFAWWAPVQAFARHGSLGVPLFFVLSGFVLAYNYFPLAGRGRFRVREYAVARFARVYPVYVFALGVGAVGAARILRTSLFSRSFLVTGLMQAGMVQSFFPERWNDFNTPGWSLSVEALFYLMFPLLLGIGRWSRRWAVLGAFGAGALATVCFPPPERFASPHLPFFYIPFFLMGMMLARCHQTAPAGRSRAWLAVAAVVAIVAVMTRPGEAAYIYSVSGVLFGVLVYALAGVGNRNWLCAPGLLLLGEASYSLYILQAPVELGLQHYWTAALRRGLLPAGCTIHGWPFFLFAMAVAVGISLASYRWLESPARGYIRRRWGRGARPAAAGAGG